MNGALSLSQRDLLGSLALLIAHEATDVRKYIVEGIHYFLLHYGQLLTVGESGGWGSILDILSVIPESLVSQGSLDISSDDVSSSNGRPWSHECLVTAFSTVKLACEEYLGAFVGDEDTISAAIKLLQSFAAQNIDVNISLTSIETMWKISGLPNKNIGSNHLANIYVLYESLALLMNDTRADVRHGALNTLFVALSANAETPSTLKLDVFQSYIFPLLDMIHRSLHAAATRLDYCFIPFI